MPGANLKRVSVSLIAYLLYLAALTLAPFEFSRTPATGLVWTGGGGVISDGVQNILGFVPFGVLLHFRMKPDATNVGRKWAVATCRAGIVSLLIETTQMFLPARVSSYADLLSNTLGGGLGFWMMHAVAQRGWTLHVKAYQRPLTVVGLMFYILGLLSFFLWASPPQTLKGWDHSYPLLIGND